jgi:chromosome segregation ATPase
VNSQKEQLARLEGLTAEQAALGKQLASLAQTLGPHSTHMAQVAKEEVALVQGLQAQTGALSAPLRRIRASNESLYRKLQEAERRSGSILDAMPL